MSVFRFFSILFALLAATGAVAAEPRLKVVASFSILADMASQIGGELVDASALVGPDGDAHVYQPTPSDAKRLAGADVVLVNGLGYEGWLRRLIAASGYKGAPVVVSAGIAVRQMDDDGHGHGGQKKINDPHAWNSVPNAQVYARNIGEAFAKARPTDAARLRANADAYIARLAVLDTFVRTELGAIPPQRRRAITSHDAFGYFAAEYGIEFLAPVGISTEAEPNAQDVGRLIRQIKAENIKAVFVESIGDQRLISRIAAESGAVVGGRLYSDALSGPGGPAGTYENMVRHNVGVLKAGLTAN